MISVSYLGLLVAIPVFAVVWESTSLGFDGFFNQITNPQAVAAIKLSLLLALAVVVINSFFGTIIAWLLVRDDFRGKGVVGAIIDLPFALPTIVAGLTLLALYGPNSPFGLNIAFTQVGVLLALLFVTLPFTVRSVQPVLIELDKSIEEAAASLGAGKFTVLRRIVLPQLLPSILTGGSLGFAKAIGEFGSVVLIAGNLPFKTEVASVFIYGQIESDNVGGAAAVSVVLLVISIAVLSLMSLVSWWSRRHQEDG